MDKAISFLKERWWLILIVSIIAVLLLIPTKSGLPSNDYKGCDNSDPKYKSDCLTTEIKSVSREGNGTTSFTVPIKYTDGTQDVTFYLKKDRGLKVGETVFINIAEYDKKAYLFINGDSNMLFTILSHVFDASQGATAKIDLNTMKEI